jgi:hypothetical protein
MASFRPGVGRRPGMEMNLHLNTIGTEKTVYEYFVDPGYLPYTGLQLLAEGTLIQTLLTDSCEFL